MKMLNECGIFGANCHPVRPSIYYYLYILMTEMTDNIYISSVYRVCSLYIYYLKKMCHGVILSFFPWIVRLQHDGINSMCHCDN